MPYEPDKHGPSVEDGEEPAGPCSVPVHEIIGERWHSATIVMQHPLTGKEQTYTYEKLSAIMVGTIDSDDEVVRVVGGGHDGETGNIVASIVLSWCQANPEKVGEFCRFVVGRLVEEGLFPGTIMEIDPRTLFGGAEGEEWKRGSEEDE